MPDEEACACGCGLPRPLYIHGHERRTFLEHVVEDRGYESPCWIVRGRRTDYAQVRHAGRHVGAHRVAYEIAKGPIPPGYHIDHLCRVTHCVNPDHLEAVSPRVNLRRQPRTKLNPALVREIRSSEESGRQIAARLGVSRATITLVRQRKTWTDVE